VTGGIVGRMAREEVCGRTSDYATPLEKSSDFSIDQVAARRLEKGERWQTDNDNVLFVPWRTSHCDASETSGQQFA